MKKELATVETSTEVIEYNPSEWGDVTLESKDLVLPRILIQHGTSESVKQKRAQEGDLLNMLTNSNYGNTVQLLPFFKRELIVVEKWNGKKFEYLKSIPYEGKMLPFEQEIEGIRYKNSHVYEVFCLTKELGLPHIVPFKGTSNKIGKNLVTMMYAQNPAERLTPAGRWITYSTKLESNKDGDSYYVANYSQDRLSTQNEVAECLKWVNVIKESNIAIEEVKEETATVESKRF